MDCGVSVSIHFGVVWVVLVLFVVGVFAVISSSVARASLAPSR